MNAYQREYVKLLREFVKIACEITSTKRVVPHLREAVKSHASMAAKREVLERMP